MVDWQKISAEVGVNDPRELIVLAGLAQGMTLPYGCGFDGEEIFSDADLRIVWSYVKGLEPGSSFMDCIELAGRIDGDREPMTARSAAVAAEAWAEPVTYEEFVDAAWMLVEESQAEQEEVDNQEDRAFQGHGNLQRFVRYTRAVQDCERRRR